MIRRGRRTLGVCSRAVFFPALAPCIPVLCMPQEWGEAPKQQ